MAGQVVGYVRVSTLDQKIYRQLVDMHLHRTFTDFASGKDTDRPQLTQMIAYVREGDTVVVHSMDRLAPNLEDLRRLVRELTEKGGRIQFLKEGLTFTAEESPMSQLLLNVMGSFAKWSTRSSASANEKASRSRKRKGAYKGRKRALTAEQVEEVVASVRVGFKKTALARKLRVSRETIHRYLHEAKASARVPEKQKEEETA